ncbi:probable helicase senataxin [Emydura macquarii macquarii]|uniref:probable helicase senataxin n=1 Tax=Emydura macquarii macquarii TaxID=1129001 RepID=UPI00352BBD6A
MSTCRWCTPGGSSTTQFLRSYASKTLSPEDLAAANDDLCYCLECVVEYHKARDELPCLQEILWELETSRLIDHFEKFMKTDIEEDDELFIVDDEGETKLSGYTGPDFENNLRVPLLEILKYPYLLLHEQISEHCVEALCKMEQVNFSFQVFDKHPGIYLLLVHPNEVIRRWAILTARNLGKVDRDDYYDLQEVFTCLFKVIELGLFDSPDIYSSSMIEKGKLILLPSHLYDTTNYKNYWLGICMLLTVLEEQAMDSLLLGPDKQNDFMQSILHTMEKQTDDVSADPFWPALHCFMVILDLLGSKVWGQLIDPVQAFQTIINNASYNNEIKNIRNSSRRTKSELESDYEDMVTCSQIVYNYNTEKPKKDTGWRTAICPDYFPNMYEDMQTLANVLQSDIGQDMRVHNSTFLWFIPFVQSLMDLKDLGVAYIVEVIHYLCSEIKNFLNERVQQCDTVSEFFILILVSVVELHRNKKCLHLLWVSSQEWVEAVVKCTKLPSIAFMRCFEKAPGNCPRVTSTISSPAFNSVQHACVQLIRSLLREGYQLGQQIVCKQFLDKLNLLLRGNLSLGWQLSSRETQELQMCLKQVIRNIKDRSPNASMPVENSMICTNLPTIPIKQEKVTAGDRGQMNIQHRNSLSPSFSLSSGRDEVCQEGPSPRRRGIWKEEYREMSFNDTKVCATAEYLLTNIKKEPHDRSFQKCEHPENSGATKIHKDSHKNGNNHEVQGNQNKKGSILKQCFNTSPQVSDFKSHAILEGDETEVRMPECLSAQPCSNSHEDIHSSIGKDGCGSPNSCPKFKIEAGKLTNFKAKVQKTDWATKLLQLMKQSASTSEVDQIQSRSESLCTNKDGSRDQGVNILNEGETSVNFNTSNGSENKQEKSMNSTFQTKLLSIKQESNGTMLDISNSFKKEVGLEESESGGEEDNIPLAIIRHDLKKKRSLSGRSSSLPKSLLNKDLNTEIPDQRQSNSGILCPSRGDRKDQKVSTLCTGETSPNVNTPSSSEDKAEILRNVPLISPIKCESTDRLFDFSRYFKRENDSGEKSNNEDNAAIACDSIKKKSGASPLTDSKVDRDLDKLSSAAYAKDVNLPVDLSQESSIHLCDIKRKVKGAVRSSIKGQNNESSSDTDCPNNEIIIISDSSSDEEKKLDIKKQIKKKLECVCPEKQPLTSGYVSDSVNKKEQLKTHSSLLLCEEYSSQYFEFETEDDIFSVWQDSQIDDEKVNQAQEQDSNLISASNDASDSLQSVDHTNDWGYDTDYISDDIIEKAAEAVERQVDSISDHKKVSKTDTKAEATFQEPVIKGNATDQSEYFTQLNAVAKDHAKNTGLMEPKASTSSIPLSSKLVIKKNTLSPGKSLAKYKLVRTALRSPRRMSLKTVQNKKFPQSSSRNTEPCRSTPAVVPPKKVRQCPEPTSTVVKLGLKKAPRKAFEYSQRSLDSLAELRSYGKAAGAVQTSQKQKTKLIAPQYLVVKHNRKMLSCQDRQFLRQMRPKQGGRGKNRVGSSEGRSKKITKKSDPKLPVQQPVAFDPASAAGTSGKQKERIAKQISYRSSNDGKKVGKSISTEREEVQTTHISKIIAPYGSTESNMKIEENNMAVPVLQIESRFSSSLTGDGKNEPAEREYVVPLDFPSTSNLEGATLEESKPKLNENSDEDDLFLTQLDPVDMELCSQMESVGDTIANEKESVDMEVDAAESLLQNEPLGIVKCKYKDCTEEVEKAGEYCSKHSATDSSDHLFVKPGLPLPSKPAKPSTAKIFSSNSSSRSARFSKDLENISKHSLPSKAKSSLIKSTVSKTENPKSVSAENRTPSFSSSLRPQNSSNVLRPQNMQINSTSSFPNRSASGVHSGQERGFPSFPQANALVTQQRDHSIFVTEILKWNYEMFVNFSQFGLPHILLQSIMVSVPVKFQGYNDYFNTFFPLMMLNAFETLAQEWIENQKTKEKNSYHLHLQNFCADLNQADFTAYIRDSDLAKQFHPKDDDLIFLVVPEKQNTFAEEIKKDSRLVYHVGFVTRFSRASLRETRQNEQHVACHLSVQTRGNLSYYINQQVKCVVISSLVTTQRKFKGLLLLSRSPLAKPIINPGYADFCPRDLNVASESTTSYMREYNADQKKAIETAYAMVKEHPRLPRICLIHGPPGTGKSKTIVGLLYRILTERSGNENPAQNLNAKIKRNRVLVCAPSNAAVDELMKKIIVEFKEKCQNINRPLGNCGDINLVRLGPEKSISSDVQRFSLDSQVKHRMDGGQPGRDQDIHRKKEALDRQLDMLARQRAMNRWEKREKRQQLDDEIGRLSKERQQLTSQLKKVRGRPQEVQASIILESHIICCTLSTSGGFLLESAFRRQGHDPFSCVIVDEAGQSCEVETLIPLTHRCSKLVLVGDPKQLPPTVISMKAQEYGYDQSMMARLHKHLEEQVQQNVIGKLPVMQLTVQYRMHPDICLFPSNYIYGRTLKTDRATEEIRCSSDWLFQPYLVFDVADGHEKRDNDSFANPQEVKLVMEIMKLIKEKKNDIGFRQIGIITPYSAQKKMIQQELEREFGKNRMGEVDTVDGFQGRQKDCIIVTCVRANSTQGSIGFLASLQRLNVTITRAKFSLFVLGRLTTLMENKDWNELIQDAQRRGAIIKTCDKSYKKDAVKILKLKPTLQRPFSYPPVAALSERATRAPACPGSDGRNEITNRKSSSDSRKHSAGAGPSAQGSGAVRQPSESQAVGSKGITIPTPVKAAVQPAVRERPRDPRLARRAEATEKEQASKNSNSSSALSNPGVALSWAPDTPTAHWSQMNTVQPTVSKAEDSNKPNKTVRQTDVPFTASHAPRQDHDWRVSVPSKEARTVSEEDQKSQNEDYRNPASRRTSEQPPGKKDLSEAKRRKVSY